MQNMQLPIKKELLKLYRSFNNCSKMQIFTNIIAMGENQLSHFILWLIIFFTRTVNLNNLYVNYDTNNPDFTNIKAWLYLSILNGVFSRGCRSIPYRTGIRRILEITKQYKNTFFPAGELYRLYETYPLVFSIKISDDHISSWDRGFAFYLMYGCKSMLGRDIDHIQPRSLLEKKGVSPEKIHSIANFQLLDIGTNRDEKRAKELSEWIKAWGENERTSYLRIHLIPPNPQYWKLGQFDELLRVRMASIIQRIKSMIPSNVVESKPTSGLIPLQTRTMATLISAKNIINQIFGKKYLLNIRTILF